MNPKFRIVTAGLVLFIAAIVFLFGASVISKTTSNSVQIGNLDSCAKNINPQIDRTLSTQIYSYVKAANNYNHVHNQPSYAAHIRKDTCNQIGTNISTNNTTISTSAILDIPVAKQSWQIEWAWVTRDQALSTDLGTVTATCLSNNELIYGDFHCANVLSLLRYGTPYYDPILKYVPYSGHTFDIAYSPANKVVTVTVLVPAVWASDPSVAQNIEASVPEWFSQNGLNINNYTVKYTVVSH